MKKDSGAPIVPPIHRATTFGFESMEGLVHAIGNHKKGFSYSRYDNPTVVEFERELARLEGADRAIAFASGMAAISTAVLALLPPGGRIVRQRELYGGSVEFFDHFGPRFASSIVEVSGSDTRAFVNAIGAGADLVYLESPVNPTLGIVELAPIAEAARAGNALTVIDNTFSTPLGQRPLEHGIDVSLHSATKYIGGHHDVIAGALATSEALGERIWYARKILGGILSPADAFLLLRGLQTLRIRLETATRSADTIARKLRDDSRVERVLYPGLEDHPRHDVARTQMKGFGAMLAFELRGDRAAAERFSDALTLIRRAGSLGGTQSVLMLPSGVSHGHLSAEARASMGISDSLIRLSVGTEPSEELVADLERGFAAIDRVTA